MPTSTHHRITSLVSESIVKYRCAQDDYNKGLISNQTLTGVIHGVYLVCLEAFEQLATAPHAYNFQRVRVINAASSIIQRMEP